jgi:hypothetical protein
VLIYPMMLGALRPLKPDNRICCDTHWMACLCGRRECKCSPRTSQDASKVLGFLPQGTTVVARPVRSVIEKLRAA